MNNQGSLYCREKNIPDLFWDYREIRMQGTGSMGDSWKYLSKEETIHDFRVLLVYANAPMDNLMPIGLSSLSGALKRRGFSVAIFDTTFYPWTDSTGGERKGTLQVPDFSYDEVGIRYKTTDVFEDFRKVVKEFRPGLIALSTVEPTHEFGMKLLTAVREFNIPTLVGGVHTTFSADDVIHEEDVDMVCIGEGEKPLVELAECLARKIDCSSIQNLWVKKGSTIIQNEIGPLISLEDLPELDFSSYDPKRIFKPMAGKMYRMVPVEFSRGCMYDCTYCSAPAFAKKFRDQGKWLRFKSIEQIMNEIRSYLDKYDVEYFYFVSETFLAMPKHRLAEFCKQYSKIGIPFWFNTRAETITQRKIRMLEDIGCHRMGMGVECGNEEYRIKMLHRRVSNERIVEACNLVGNSSIQLSVNNIVGLPDETRSMIFETIYLNRLIEADTYGCFIFQPYRGTFLHNYCVEKGYIDPKQLANDPDVSPSITQPSISADEVRGITRTFPLYVKFPKSDFDLIRKAEQFNDEGNRIFNDLSKIYREKYEKKRIRK